MVTTLTTLQMLEDVRLIMSKAEGMNTLMKQRGVMLKRIETTRPQGASRINLMIETLSREELLVTMMTMMTHQGGQCPKSSRAKIKSQWRKSEMSHPATTGLMKQLLPTQNLRHLPGRIVAGETTKESGHQGKIPERRKALKKIKKTGSQNHTGIKALPRISLLTTVVVTEVRQTRTKEKGETGILLHLQSLPSKHSKTCHLGATTHPSNALILMFQRDLQPPVT